MTNPRDNKGDAVGAAIWDRHKHNKGFEVIEWPSGYVICAENSWYFDGFEQWQDSEQQAIGKAKGRVLDIGAGAGRHSLHLQSQGMDITASDISEYCIEVCKQRGVKKVLLVDFRKIHTLGQTFDTFLLMGNNWSFMQNEKVAIRTLKYLAKHSSKEATIIAETINPHLASNKTELGRNAQNLEKGKLAGERKVRIRYLDYRSGWFNFLGSDPGEVSRLAGLGGWALADVFQDEGNISYTFVLTKKG